MTSRLEAYRVTAYNTSKQSENKIHDEPWRGASALAAAWSPAST